jgi:VCBS repeat-containing protein
MAIWLRQSTAQTVVMGPFLSTSDGFTPQTSLSIVQADVRVSKLGATFAQKNDTTTSPHMENGEYAVTLSATDSGTLGPLRLDVFKSGALPVWRDCMVVVPAVWDAFYAAGQLSVNVAAMAANVITGTVLATDSISSAQIATGAATEIAAAVKALVIETQGSYTLGQALSIMLAVLAGRTSSSGATMSTPDGSVTRVAATIDGSNNRMTMSLTPSS